VGSEGHVARPVAVGVRNYGPALLCRLPQPATQLRSGYKTHHRIYDTKSALVDCSRSLSCSRLCDCPRVVGSPHSVDRIAGDRVDPSRIPGIVHHVGGDVEACQSRSIMN